MVEPYTTEEEQVEALRKWWRENSKSTIAAIVFALAAGYGWQGWQKHQTEQSESASAVYQDMLTAVSVATGGEKVSEENKATARHLAAALKDDHSGSSYALFAAMQLAKMSVEQDELEQADTELRWVLTQNPEQDILRIAQLRLARVTAAQGRLQEALEMLSLQGDAYDAMYSEVKGDIFLQLEQPEQALSAYRQASSNNELKGRTNSSTLDLKLQSLQLEPARATSTIAQEG